MTMPPDLLSDELRGAGDERAGRSCAFDRASAAEAVDLRIHGAAEGQERDPGVQRVSGFATAPFLGQSLLGAGLLRRNCGVGPRDDTEVCKMAGEAGTTSRGVPIQPRMNKPGQRAAPSALQGLGLFSHFGVEVEGGAGVAFFVEVAGEGE